LAAPLFYVCWRVGLVRMKREEGEGQTSLKPLSKHEEKDPIMFTSTGRRMPPSQLGKSMPTFVCHLTKRTRETCFDVDFGRRRGDGSHEIATRKSNAFCVPLTATASVDCKMVLKSVALA